LIGYAVPVVGVLLGLVALREQFTWNLAAGTVLVVLGIAIFGR